MATEAAEDKKRKNRSKLKILLLLLLSNLVTIFIFAGPFNTSPFSNTRRHASLILQLSAAQTLISELQHKINSTNLLLQALLIELTRDHKQQQLLPTPTATEKLTISSQQQKPDPDANWMRDELKLAIGVGLGLHSPLGAECFKFQEELIQYMTYEVGGECHVDDVFAQKLMLKGCHPLPRRRCHPKSPVGYVEPTPLPDSLWATPPDTSVNWDPYTCKSYQDCFNLLNEGRDEENRWILDRGLDYGIDEVLASTKRAAGTIRIGLDIGDGTGTFAARMWERNVIVITTMKNVDAAAAPFSSFIASRGLIAMQHTSISERLPFFENTMDIVHYSSSDHVVVNSSNGNHHEMESETMLIEFTLYDIYRVLRPGGLLWLDRFSCSGWQLNETYVPMTDRVGFKKLRWDWTGGDHKDQLYFSALFEKPMT